MKPFIILIPSITDWIIAIGTLITAGTIVGLIWTVLLQKKQLLVSNFEVITNYIGSEKTRYARRIMIKHYESPISNNFFQGFPIESEIDNARTNNEFDDYNEWGKYIGAIYSRVSFLLLQDKGLKEKFIEHHGYTIGIMWIMYKPFMQMWETHDAIKKYKDFKEIGEFCYCNEKPDIDKFLEKKKEHNKNRTVFEWFTEKRKSPLEW